LKLNETKLDDNRVRIDAVASIEEVDQAFADAAEQLAQNAEENLTALVAERLIPFALDKGTIVPAFPPHASFDVDPEEGKEFAFQVEVLVKPCYELSSYDPITLFLPDTQVKESEIDLQLVEIADSYAEYITDEPRPVVLGDSIMMSMEAFDQGEPIPELTIDKRTYLTDANMMPSGFDENLVGMEVGDTKSFQITGPVLGDNGEEIEKVVDCTVTVLEIQKKVIPAISDAWVKENIPAFDTVAQLREEIRKQLSEARTNDLEEYKRQAAVSELCGRFQGEITEEVHEENKKALLSNITAQLEQQGIAMDWFVKQNGGQENFDASLAAQTNQSLIEGYVLDALFRHENMSLEEEDIVEACKSVNPDQPTEIREQMEKCGYTFALRETAARIKANKWLVDTAKITTEAE
jgi:trigger factor